MSFDIWHDNGYGFETTELQSENFIDFLKKHRNTVATIRNGEEMLKAMENENAAMEDIVDKFTDSFTASEIIADIITKESGITFWGSGVDDDGREAIMFYPRYPWEMNERVAKLTEEELETMLTKYINELHVPEVPQTLSLIYSG